MHISSFLRDLHQFDVADDLMFHWININLDNLGLGGGGGFYMLHINKHDKSPLGIVIPLNRTKFESFHSKILTSLNCILPHVFSWRNGHPQIGLSFLGLHRDITDLLAITAMTRHLHHLTLFSRMKIHFPMRMKTGLTKQKYWNLHCFFCNVLVLQLWNYCKC